MNKEFTEFAKAGGLDLTQKDGEYTDYDTYREYMAFKAGWNAMVRRAMELVEGGA